jgi:hypothetical protein
MQNNISTKIFSPALLREIEEIGCVSNSSPDSANNTLANLVQDSNYAPSTNAFDEEEPLPEPLDAAGKWITVDGVLQLENRIQRQIYIFYAYSIFINIK